jgi:hypothetical protein
MNGLDPVDPMDGKALLAELSLGWNDSNMIKAVLTTRYVQVDEKYSNPLAQSASFNAERVMNQENDLSDSTVGSALYSTFDALYAFRPKHSPLRNAPYQQAPYIQNSYTNAIGSANFAPDNNLQLLFPNGYATANREGVDLDLNATALKWVGVKAVFSQLKQMKAVAGDYDVAKYGRVGGGLDLELNRLLGLNKTLTLSGSFVQSKATTYTGVAPMDYAYVSNFINGGLNWRFLDKMGLLVGYQQIASELTWEGTALGNLKMDKTTQGHWRTGIEYEMKDGAYAIFSVGQINVDRESLDMTDLSIDKGDFSQFLTQFKIRAQF